MKRLTGLILSLTAACALSLGCTGSEKKVEKPKDDIEEVKKDDKLDENKDENNVEEEDTEVTDDGTEKDKPKDGENPCGENPCGSPAD